VSLAFVGFGALATSAACLVTVDPSLVTRDAGSVDGGDDDRDGSGAVDGGSVTDVDGGAGRSCPAGRGAAMILYDGFCIDERETTFADYRAFVADDAGASSAGSSVPAECAFKTSFLPLDWPRAVAEDPLPASEVDWCDAWAYCAWAGKRLCGGDHGAALPFASLTDPTDEWFRACTNGRTTKFPYGTSFDVRICNVAGYAGGTNQVEAPGAATACHGLAAPLDRVTDLVGNVAEWTRSCEHLDGVDAAAEACHLRGAHFYAASQDGCNDDDSLPRAEEETKAGIRCCADPR